MLTVFLLELLSVLQGDALPVLENAQLLAPPRLPQPQVHLVRTANDILKNEVN